MTQRFYNRPTCRHQPSPNSPGFRQLSNPNLSAAFINRAELLLYRCSPPKTWKNILFHPKARNKYHLLHRKRFTIQLELSRFSIYTSHPVYLRLNDNKPCNVLWEFKNSFSLTTPKQFSPSK